MSYHLGVLASHPIQYHSPWFRYLAQRLDLEVFYCHRQGVKGQANAGFGVEFDWDTPLLEGYTYRWLTNMASRPNVQTFNGCDTPAIDELIRRGDFDAFMVFGWNRKSALQAMRACWRDNIPILMRGDSQLTTSRSQVKTAVKYFPYRWFLPRLDAHLFVGERNRDYLLHYGVQRDQLVFAPHFVDNAYFSDSGRKAEIAGQTLDIRETLGIPRDAFVFTFVGKMLPRKRPADFIQACLKTFNLPEFSDSHALLIGDGLLRTALEEMARPQEDRIHFAGFRNQTELPAFYKTSNILVLPSDGSETWGLVVNEAMACGIPCIVSDAVGCAPDLIDEELTGLSFPVGNVEMLACQMQAMKTACENNPIAIQRALLEKSVIYSMERATVGLEEALDAVTHKPKAKSFLQTHR
jgi:glycosyltransferase involved in cell wall biosynthesis